MRVDCDPIKISKISSGIYSISKDFYKFAGFLKIPEEFLVAAY